MFDRFFKLCFGAKNTVVSQEKDKSEGLTSFKSKRDGSSSYLKKFIDLLRPELEDLVIFEIRNDKFYLKSKDDNKYLIEVSLCFTFASSFQVFSRVEDKRANCCSFGDNTMCYTFGYYLLGTFYVDLANMIQFLKEKFVRVHIQCVSDAASINNYINSFFPIDLLDEPIPDKPITFSNNFDSTEPANLDIDFQKMWFDKIQETYTPMISQRNNTFGELSLSPLCVIKQLSTTSLSANKFLNKHKFVFMFIYFYTDYFSIKLTIG
jgi:hypothetical protein